MIDTPRPGRENLRRLLAPRHVAVIGGEAAGEAARQCLGFGFPGPVWAVNPRRESLGGRECFRSVFDLPEPPDAVFLAVPRDAAAAVVADLAAIGAGGVICFTDGFREAGEAGAGHEARLVAAAGDLALVGPNCFGIVDARSGLALWPYGHGCARRREGVAIISQSGMLASNVTMSRRALPIACVISCGNQAMLTIESFMEALLDDPAISGFGLYVEELRDVAAFTGIARRARAARRPIVALKAGASAIGAALARGHTGADTGDREVYRALFRETGVIPVDSPAQMIETLKMATLGGIPRGRRVAVITGSGGDAALAADRGSEAGLLFPVPSGERAQALRRLRPATVAVSNPLDLTHALWGRPEVADLIRAMIGRDHDAALLVQDYPRPELGISVAEDRSDACAFATAVRESGIPGAVCSSLPDNMDEDTQAFIAALGVAPLQGIGEAVRAIADVAGYGERLDRPDSRPVRSDPSRAG